MRSCYVSIPFGVKMGPDGAPIDFDVIYHQVIAPAVRDLGIECRRLDEFAASAIWHKMMFGALIGSDLMIADLSTHNPNVLYELGVRHALRRGRTLLISGQGQLPFDLNYAQVLFYEVQDGRLKNAEAFRSTLQSLVRQSQRSTISDSPLYEFFPDLDVSLPPELAPERSAPRSSLTKARKPFVQSVVESPVRAARELEQTAQELRTAPGSDPMAYLSLMRKSRDLSQWDQVVALAADAPPEIGQSPEVRQLLALALNRRQASGDRERAVALMQELITETGGDGETFGILGRIYKDLADQALKAGDTTAADAHLELALQSYRAGFEKNPKDYYPGVNVVTLLQQRGDAAALAELAQVLPRVRTALQERMQEGVPDYWALATDLELSVVAGDWDAAEQAVERALAVATSRWMLDSTRHNLERVLTRLPASADLSRAGAIVGRLQAASARSGEAA